MEFPPELIQEKYSTLPPNVKRALDSADVGMIVTQIAKEFTLHVDQIGVLDEEIIFVMLGLRKITEFQEKIQKRLGLDDATIIKIAQEINDKVFVTVKDSVMHSSQASGDDLKNRDEILNEIENPTPVEHPISIAKEVPAFPIAKEVVSEKIPEKSKEEVAHAFIAEKLTETVTAPTTPTTPKYSADPYREPLI